MKEGSGVNLTINQGTVGDIKYSKLCFAGGRRVSVLPDYGTFANDETKRLTGYGGDATSRIPARDLEKCVHLDPVVANGVNTVARTIFRTPFRLECENEANTKKIEQSRKDLNFDLYYPELIINKLIFGESWLEMKRTDTQEIDVSSISVSTNTEEPVGDIVGFAIVDPKTMFFITNQFTGEPKEDSYGRKYYQDVNGKRLYLFESQILWVPMYRIGGSIDPVGIVEPIYEVTKLKLNIQNSYAQWAWREGNPLRVVYIGNEEHEPDPKMTKAITDTVYNANANTVLSIPFFSRLETVGSSTGMQSEVNKVLSYLETQQCAGLGVPKGILLGTGNEINRATLDAQIQEFLNNIAAIQNFIIAPALKPLWAALAKQLGFENDVPEMIFDELDTKDRGAEMESITQLIMAGAMNVDKPLRDYIRDVLDLPEEEEVDEEVIDRETREMLKELSGVDFEDDLEIPEDVKKWRDDVEKEQGARSKVMEISDKIRGKTEKQLKGLNTIAERKVLAIIDNELGE